MSIMVAPIKYVDENSKIVFDFASQLDIEGGEALTGATCTCVVSSGVDPSPDDFLDGAASLNLNVVTQQLTGGLAGVIYLVNAAGTTNQGNLRIIQAYVGVLSNNPFQE